MQKTILFIDEDQMVIDSLKTGLADQAFSCLFSSSPLRGLEIVQEKDIAVIVSALKMHEMNGINLFGKIKEKSPDTVRILLTSHSQVSTILSAINSGNIDRYLVKPWKLEEQMLPILSDSLILYESRQNRNSQQNKLNNKIKMLQLEMDEIQKTKAMMASSDENKDEIIKHIVEKVIPYISSVVEISFHIRENPESITDMDLDVLNKKGMEIMGFLLKVKAMIN